MAEIATKLAWSRAAGDGLRRHAIPFRLFRKTLVVSVADLIWQKQMQSMTTELVARINRLLGAEVVETIEFRIDPGPVQRVRAEMQTRPGPRDKTQDPIPAELLSAAGEITDPDLRDRFMRAAGNCIARREARDGSE